MVFKPLFSAAYRDKEMSCFSPLVGHRTGVNAQSGKWIIKIDGMTDAAHKAIQSGDPDYFEVPCGKCLGCRLQKGQDWSGRMLLESLCHKENWFVTLTYDDEHVPRVLHEDESGSLVALETLRKKDIQEFNKNLKNWLRKYKREHNIADPDFEKFRFYTIGEYGSSTFRSHYHGIYFGLPVPDVIVKPGTAPTVNGDIIYWSGVLENEIWKKGFVELGSVTPASTSYVGRYVMKKAVGDSPDFDELGIEPEFSLMSRRPAIGRPFFDQNPHMFDTGVYHVATEDGSVAVFPDRYFRKVLDHVDPWAKPERKANQFIRNVAKDQVTQLDYLDQLSVKQEIKNKQIKSITKREI